MSADPEEIIQAFYDLLVNKVGDVFKTKDRRASFWTKVPNQPALFVRHISDKDDWSGEGLQRLTIGLEVWIYAKTPMPDTPDLSLNQLIKLVREAIQPDITEDNLSLGGLVHYCRIEGLSEYDPGDLDTQGKAVIPVSILTTP